jgi:two-component system, NtrC family, sensor kinase
MGRPAKELASSLTARLGAAFAAVLVLFAAALFMTFRTLNSLADAEREVVQLDEAKHAGHAVAGLVREEYIHQAHTIIEWDRSHLDHYEVAARRAREATARLLKMPLTSGERRQAAQIHDLEVRIDGDFHTQILPAVDAHDAARVHSWHEHTEAMVNRVVTINEELNNSLERRAMAALDLEEGLRRYAVRVVLCCFGLAIAVTVAAWVLIGQSVLRRILELRKGALALAAGELRARVVVSGSDEIAELGKTFNEMAASLESNQEKLIQSQRLALLGQVAAGVAHEINNPLAVILGYVKLLGRNSLVTGEAAEQLRIVEDEANQCQRIVQALLDLGRPVPSTRAVVNLSDVAREAIDRLAETGKLGERQLSRPPLDERATLRGDPAALRQVVSNLVLNAIEATAERGALAVAVSVHGSSVELTVDDDGPGLAPSAREHAFEPFFTTKRGGTGLGLAISQAIAMAHQGTLELEPAPGRGTRARLSFPRSDEIEKHSPMVEGTAS